jgi:HEPN domain-containing protein
VQSWTRLSIKSQRDLGAAWLLFESEASFLDVVVYHCQQAAEKALKAYLAYRDVIFQKTHNLNRLLELCLPFDPCFQELWEMAEVLTPYVVAFRYPGSAIESEKQEAEQAIEMAKSFLTLVLSALLDEIVNELKRL